MRSEYCDDSCARWHTRCKDRVEDDTDVDLKLLGSRMKMCDLRHTLKTISVKWTLKSEVVD